MQLPLGLGKLDFGDWLYGLFAAFIGGGASAVTSGVTLNVVDPKDFNIYGSKLYVMMGAMFLANGTLTAAAFLRTKPLPGFKEVTTTTERTEVQTRPAATVVTTVKEVETVKIPQPPAPDAPKE